MDSTSPYLSVRLTTHDEKLLDQLCERMGLSRAAFVKQALRDMAAANPTIPTAPDSLYSLGLAGFGQHGDSQPQSASIKAMIRKRVRAKHQP